MLIPTCPNCGEDIVLFAPLDNPYSILPSRMPPASIICFDCLRAQVEMEPNNPALIARLSQYLTPQQYKESLAEEQLALQLMRDEIVQNWGNMSEEARQAVTQILAPGEEDSFRKDIERARQQEL